MSNFLEKINEDMEQCGAVGKWFACDFFCPFLGPVSKGSAATIKSLSDCALMKLASIRDGETKWQRDAIEELKKRRPEMWKDICNHYNWPNEAEKPFLLAYKALLEERRRIADNRDPDSQQAED